MLKKTIKTIHGLRIYFLAIITVLSFYHIGINPVDVSKFIGAKMSSAVGMSISIPENPFNKLALQFKEKEKDLFQKEKELDQREKELKSRSNTGNNKTFLFMAGGIVVLLLLILLNFYFDYRRKKAKN